MRTGNSQRKHIVVQHERDWVLFCTGNVAIRDHLGLFDNVTCQDCRVKYRKDDEPPSDPPAPRPVRKAQPRKTQSKGTSK